MVEADQTAGRVTSRSGRAKVRSQQLRWPQRCPMPPSQLPERTVGHAGTMWLAAGALGAVVVVATVVLLAIAARLLPPGRSKDLAGLIPNSIVLLRRLRANRRLPGRVRLALGAALGYVLSPIQLIPNFIPIVGQADDLAVITLSLRYACRRMPPDDVRAAWPGNPEHLDRLLGHSDQGATRGSLVDPRQGRRIFE